MLRGVCVKQTHRVDAGVEKGKTGKQKEIIVCLCDNALRDFQVVMDLRTYRYLLDRYILPDYEQQAEDFGGLQLVFKCTYLETGHPKNICCAS